MPENVERGRLLPAYVEALFPGRMEASARVLTTKTVAQAIVAQVTEGKYKVTIPSGSETIQPGEVCIIPSQTPVSFLHIPDPRTGKMRSQWVHLRASLFGVVDISSLLSLPLKVTGQDAHRLGGLIQACLDDRPLPEGLAKSINMHHHGFGFIREFLTLAGPQAQLEGRLTAITQLQPTLALIKENLDKPITIGQIAKWAHLSPSRLHTVFVHRLGHAPMSYVRIMRLREAQRLLAGTDQPISQIAQNTGFACQFHFARTFKRAVGVTPSKYREESTSSA